MSYNNQEFLNSIQNTECRDRNPVCPFCGSKEVKILEARSTMRGSLFNLNPDYDDNHRRSDCECSCGKTFTFEQQGYTSWYTKQAKVLKGIAGCCEPYVHMCKCGGDFIHEYKDIDGSKLKHGTSVEVVKNYITVYKCLSCGKEINE